MRVGELVLLPPPSAVALMRMAPTAHNMPEQHSRENSCGRHENRRADTTSCLLLAAKGELAKAMQELTLVVRTRES